jgi:hypothetical protein
MYTSELNQDSGGLVAVIHEEWVTVPKLIDGHDTGWRDKLEAAQGRQTQQSYSARHQVTTTAFGTSELNQDKVGRVNNHNYLR